MRIFHTATVELQQPFTAEFASEPFECGWASEARFFLQATEDFDWQRIDGRVQVSPDGIIWLDEGSTLSIERGQDPLLVSLVLKDFGGWLRLTGTIHNSATAELTIHLALKE